jgi:hypothetical protein
MHEGRTAQVLKRQTATATDDGGTSGATPSTSGSGTDEKGFFSFRGACDCHH